MAKDDPGGLLSKVVRFVRNPATNWSDLDEPESVGDSGNSRQMLKELVERKKRNDFVRKREFEMLRKLRRREMAGSQASAPRPSFFQSSLPSKPDERAQVVAIADEGVIGKLGACTRDWCEIEAGGEDGWVEKKRIWGVDPEELRD